MAILTQAIPQVQPQAIATYSFTDIEEGTGVVVFHGFNTEDNSAVDYHLSSQAALFSGDLITISNQSGDTGDDIKVLDLDFDVKFNLPKDVKGTFRALVPAIAGNSSANEHGQAYVILRVRHFDGTIETDLVNVRSKQLFVGLGSGVVQQDFVNIEVELTTKQHFKKGETLRLTVELYATFQGSNGMTSGIMHDPKNRTPGTGDYPGFVASTFITSDLIFHVPFVIDL